MPHPDADRLRKLAADLREQAVEAETAGAEEMARGYRAAADRLDEARWVLTGLTDYPRGRKVNSKVTPEAREAISRRFGGDDPNVAAARAADPAIRSLRDLAARLDVTASFLSQVRAGSKKLPPALAAKFRALTGQDWQ